MPRLTLITADPWTDLSALTFALARGAAGDAALYPDTGRGPAGGHDHLAWALTGDARARPDHGDWTALAAEIACAEPDHVVLAACFAPLPPARALRRIRRHLKNVVDDIHIAAYIRPHAPRALDAQATLLRRGVGPFETRAFLDWALTSGAFLAGPMMQDWRAAAGDDHFTLTPLSPDHLADGDPACDFVRRALGADNAARRAPPRSPTAPERRMMQIYGAAMTLIGGPPLARQMGAEIADMAADAFAGADSPARWSHVQMRDLTATFTEDAQMLDTLMGQRVFVDALREKKAQEKALGAPRPALSAETEIALRASAHVLARLAAARRKAKSIQSSVNSQAA